MIYLSAYVITGLLFALLVFSTDSNFEAFRGFAREYYWKLKIVVSWLLLFFWLFYVVHKIVYFKRDFLVVIHADILVRLFWRRF
jgi:hypothetical protein